MSQKSRTPDERFLYYLYEMAVKTQDISIAYSVASVAKVVGQKQTAAKHIVKHLAQANLVLKDEDSIVLTQRGYEMVEQFLV